MTSPLRPRSPRWSVALRIGVGVAVFGLFVMLFSFDSSRLGLAVFTLGLACVLASVVFYLQDRRRDR